jgi:hypothetical protein
MEDIQGTGEASSPQKKTSVTFKTIDFFTYFVFFATLFRIRIQPTEINADSSGSGSDTLLVMLI